MRTVLPALAALLCAVVAPNSARSDAVMGPPTHCPPGSIGRSNHGGPYCQIQECADGRACPEGSRCSPVPGGSRKQCEPVEPHPHFDPDTHRYSYKPLFGPGSEPPAPQRVEPEPEPIAPKSGCRTGTAPVWLGGVLVFLALGLRPRARRASRSISPSRARRRAEGSRSGRRR